MLLIDDANLIISLMAFTTFVELGIFLTYYFDFKRVYEEDLEYSKVERDA